MSNLFELVKFTSFKIFSWQISLRLSADFNAISNSDLF